MGALYWAGALARHERHAGAFLAHPLKCFKVAKLQGYSVLSTSRLPFLSPQDPPPILLLPLLTMHLPQRISKLAHFGTRHGPSFVDLMRTKQAGKAEYDFLNAGR